MDTVTPSSDKGFHDEADSSEIGVGATALNEVGAIGASEEEPEPWPPREWREASRSLGRREAAVVFGAIFGIIGVLVLVSIWAANAG